MTPDDLKAPWEHMAEGEMLERLRRAAPLLVALWEVAEQHLDHCDWGEEKLRAAVDALREWKP